MRKHVQQLFEILEKYDLSQQDQMRIIALTQRMARTNPWDSLEDERDLEHNYLDDLEDLDDDLDDDWD